MNSHSSPVPMIQASKFVAPLLLAVLVSCATDPGDPTVQASGDHPIPNGQWPPTTGDVWPGLQSAFDFQGCAAYGGIPVRTVVQDFNLPEVRSVSVLDSENMPAIVINPVMFQEHERSRRFLYFHECAHHMLQHPALRVIDAAPEPIDQEYDANCHAASYLLRNELFDRLDIDFMLLVLKNNRGPDRPPGQADNLVECLQARGLY